MRKAFNTIALGADFGIVALLRYTILQWNRKYHESGNFSMELPLEQYSADIKYIYTKARPEMGVVKQVNYVESNGKKSVYLSGYFLEKEPGRRVVYPYADVSNITNQPAWLVQEGDAETVAHQFFVGFKDISFNQDGVSYTKALPIKVGDNLGRGNTAKHTRNNEYLDNKLFAILKPSGLSYRIVFDFESSEMTFEVWSGVDRREEQTENNPIIFSTKYGNIKEPNVVISNSDAKNICVSYTTYQDAAGTSKNFVQAVMNDDDVDSHLAASTTLNRGNYASDSEFLAGMANDGLNMLGDYETIVNVQFDTMTGSYEYMEDFNLGDNTSIEIPEIGLSGEARIIGCYEVMKNGEWSMTLEFGTPIIRGY